MDIILKTFVLLRAYIFIEKNLREIFYPPSDFYLILEEKKVLGENKN